MLYLVRLIVINFKTNTSSDEIGGKRSRNNESADCLRSLTI
ncbi:hypothetical protein [Bacillus cereus]|nr:hypothetical protein [Bacillus cereus]MDD0821026.1 hypothetical protein [Bacillus cereus]